MLERRVALLPWLLGPTRLIEAGDSSPGTVGTGLTGLGVETSGKGVVMSKNGTIALQIGLSDIALVHPLAQTLIADELCDPYGFIHGGILLGVANNFVLEDQHASCPFTCSLLY